MVYPHNGILFVNKKEWAINICNNMDKSQEHMLSERNHIQKVLFHLHKFLEKAKL